MGTMDWKKETPSRIYPEGTYKVRIEDWERVTASTGTPQILWRTRILEPAKFEGKSIISYTALTDKALWKVAWLVSACGVNVDKLGKMSTESALFNRVLNACKERTTYWHLALDLDLKGKEKNQVDDYKRDGEQPEIEVRLEGDEPDFLKDEES